MELKKPNVRDMSRNHSLNQYIPQEGFSDRMITVTTPKKIYWRPHNYRRIVKIKRQPYSGMPLSQLATYTTTQGQHSKLIFIKGFSPNITLQLGRNTLTAIYWQTKISGQKETYLIERDSLEEIQSFIDNKKEEIREKLDGALVKFARKFKLIIPYEKIKWNRYEDFIKEDGTNIPKEVIVHDTYFKKVYQNTGLEFKSSKKYKEPAVHLKNYIKNRAIEDISPEIAAEIRNFNYNTAQLLGEFSEQIRLYLAVLKNIDKTMQKFNSKLTQKKLGEWI